MSNSATLSTEKDHQGFIAVALTLIYGFTVLLTALLGVTKLVDAATFVAVGQFINTTLGIPVGLVGGFYFGRRR